PPAPRPPRPGRPSFAESTALQPIQHFRVEGWRSLQDEFDEAGEVVVDALCPPRHSSRNAMVDDRGTWQLLTPRYGSQTGEDACVLVRTLPRRRTAISELIGSDPSFGTSGYQIAVTTTLSLLLPGTRSVLAVAALAVIVSDPDAEATKVTGKIFEAPVAKRPAAHFTVLEVGCVHPVGKDPETAMLEGSE